MKKYLLKAVGLILAVCVVLTTAACKDNKNDKKPTKSKPNDSSSSSPVSSDDNSSDNNSDLDSDDDFDLDLDLDDDFFDFSITNEATVNLKNNNPIKSNYAGLSGLLHCYWFMPDNTLEDSYTEEELNISIKRLLQMGTSVIRTFYAPGWSWDKDKADWDWDSEYMKGFYKFCDLLKKNNIDIIVNPIEGLTNSASSNIGETNPFPILAGGDEEKCYDYYGQWCVDFVKEVIVKRGYSNIKYFMQATEPNNSDPSINKFNNWLKQVRKCDEALKKAGLRDKLKFVGPNSSVGYDTNNLTGFQWLEWAVKYGNDVIDIYSNHTYVFSAAMADDYESFWREFSEKCEKIVAPTGKPFWHDEYNVVKVGSYRETAKNPLQATQVALAQVAMMNAGVDSSVVWQLADIKWPNTTTTAPPSWEEGIHVIGLDTSILQSTIPRNAYYVYCMLGTAIKAGDKIYKGVSETDGVYSVMTEHKDGKRSIIVINLSWNDCDVTLNFDKSIGGKTFERRIYNPNTFKATTKATPIGVDGTLKNIKSTLKDKVGSYSVVVYNEK